jgi:hypothetical protein
MLLFMKWMLVVISIITGDKESLHEYGNLCEKGPGFWESLWEDQRAWEIRKRQEDWRHKGEGNMF